MRRNKNLSRGHASSNRALRQRAPTRIARDTMPSKLLRKKATHTLNTYTHTHTSGHLRVSTGDAKKENTRTQLHIHTQTHAQDVVQTRSPPQPAAVHYCVQYVVPHGSSTPSIVETRT